MSAELELGRQVLDKGLVTRDERRAGKVDDLLLDVDLEDPGASPPEVCAIITGPVALAEEWPGPLRAAVRHLYRWIGIDDPSPTVIPWSQVTLIHAVIRLNLTREDACLAEVGRAVDRRFISKIPGA